MNIPQEVIRKLPAEAREVLEQTGDIKPAVVEVPFEPCKSFNCAVQIGMLTKEQQAILDSIKSKTE